MSLRRSADRAARWQAYKTLSDPEKRAKWQSGENPEESGIPSDTQSLTDMNAESYIGAEHAALVLAYSDYSSECWEMADEWEAVGKVQRPALPRAPPPARGAPRRPRPCARKPPALQAAGCRLQAPPCGFRGC